MVTPNSNITLLKTPMELSDANTLSFATETAKYNYFNSLTKLALTGATYQRKEGVVRYPTTSTITFEDILEYNYCMYQNASYDTKWFYAYITDVKYINDGMVEISLRTDAFMTWQNDIVYKASFIEREHVGDDTRGLHTIPEGLETGEYVVDSKTQESYNSNLCCVIGSTASPGEYANLYGGYYNGIPSGITYYRYDDYTDIPTFLNALAINSKIDAVIDMFLAPKWLAGGTSWQNVTIPTSNTVASFDFSVPEISTIDGYTPKNNKTLCYPYCYTILSNEQGSQGILHQELWTNATGTTNKKVRVYGCLTPGCSIRAVPLDYKDNAIAFIEGINLGKFPQLNWTTDQYTNWLTQNGVNIATSIASGATNLAIGVGTGKVSSIIGGASQITSTLGEVYAHSLVPDQAKGNTNNGDVTTASSNNIFTAYNMTIRSEMAKVIDDYFTMYGYKVNALEVINPHKRTYFDYIKTIGCNIIGNIPQADMEEIRKLYDNGLTIWHDTTKFLDYSVNNAIIS